MEETGSVTAKLCAYARAYHSCHDEGKIFDDYLAAELMGSEEYRGITKFLVCDKSMRCMQAHAHLFGDKETGGALSFDRVDVCPVLRRYISPIPLSRVAFMEEELDDFADAHGACQYVICGAGLDTFAFRNSDERIRVFEVDHPSTQRAKLARIAELGWDVPTNLSFVPVDFNVDDVAARLVESGFDPCLPTFASVPGVTYYLPLSSFKATVRALASVMPEGSELVFDYPMGILGPASSERVRTLADLASQCGEPMSGGYAPCAVRKLLGDAGFALERQLSPWDIQELYFGDCDGAMFAFENVNFVAARKRAGVPDRCTC